MYMIKLPEGIKRDHQADMDTGQANDDVRL